MLFLLLGLGAGAVYASLALGLVVVHRVSGVVNIAHGAMASVATYVFVDLRGRLPFDAAFVLALLAAAALGLLAHALVFGPLRAAPALSRVVASVGVMITLQAAIVLRFGSTNRSVAAVLPAQPTHLLGLDVPRDRLLLAALAVVAGAGLWALGRWTRIGLAARAVADDPTTTAGLGWSPSTIAAGCWVLASVLAGVAGILAAPISSLNPTTYSLLVVPALAAALAGGLSSFGGTVAAGLALGMVQSLLVKLQADVAWLSHPGLREAVPFVVIVVAMAVRGPAIASRDAPTRARLPVAPRPRVRVGPSATAAVVTGGALFVLGPELRLALIQSLVAAVVCLSLVLLTGYLGQISLAQMAFAGVAGFTLARLGGGAGIPFPVAPLLAAGVAGSVGLLVGLPALRVRGVNLAVVTLAGAVAIEELVFKSPALTGGVGGTRVPDPRVLVVDLGIGRSGASTYPRPAFGLFLLAVVIAVAVGVGWVRRSAWGRRLLAVRSDERAAAAVGLDVATVKLAGFGASAFVAGLGGALLAYAQGRLSFASFGVFVSLSYLAVAYVGGISRVAGALAGGALVSGGVLFAALDRVAHLGRYQLLVTGLALVAMVVRYPDGVVAAASRVAPRRR